MAGFINYIIMAVGIFVVLISAIFIFMDKIKGEDIYFNLDVKEQELKKVIEDADDIIAELNYTSEAVIKEIEQKFFGVRETLNKQQTPQPDAQQFYQMQQQQQQQQQQLKAEIKPTIATINTVRKPSKLTAEKNSNQNSNKEDLTSKQKAVFELVDQGLSVTDIAKEMNIGQGEVLLILSLKNEE